MASVVDPSSGLRIARLDRTNSIVLILHEPLPWTPCQQTLQVQTVLQLNCLSLCPNPYEKLVSGQNHSHNVLFAVWVCQQSRCNTCPNSGAAAACLRFGPWAHFTFFPSSLIVFGFYGYKLQFSIMQGTGSGLFLLWAGAPGLFGAFWEWK